MVASEIFYAFGLLLVVLGVLIIVFAVLRRSVLEEAKGSVRGGGVVIIGPIPIIFGTDKKSVKAVLLLSILLTVLLLVTIIVSYFLSR